MLSLLQILEDNNLIKFVKRGRIKIIELTKLGEEVSEVMEKLVRSFAKADD